MSSVRSRTGLQNTDAADALGSSRVEDASEEAATRFGTVKVQAPCLSRAVNTKTYVVSNRTTSTDLVAIVLDAYKVLYEDPSLFYIGLERTQTNQGRCIKLQDHAKPFVVQGRYPKGEAIFTLHLRGETGVVTVHDQIIHIKPPVAKSIFVKESSTCLDAIKVLLRAASRPGEDASRFCLHEVDRKGQNFAVNWGTKPLTVQQEWIDPYDRYFEVCFRKEKTRRSHSLEDVRTKHHDVNTNSVKQSLSCKKAFNQESKENLKYIGVKSENFLRGKTNMAKLNENLNKLRQHIVSIKQHQHQEAHEISNGLGGNVNTGPTQRPNGQIKNNTGQASRGRSSERQGPHSHQIPVQKLVKSETSLAKSFRNNKEKINPKRVKSANNIQSRSNSSLAYHRTKDKTPEVKMSAFERRRLYDSKVRGMMTSNQSLAGSTSSRSAPSSRPISPDREMLVQGFKPITPMAKLKKGEAKRVLPKPPPDDNIDFDFRMDSFSDSELSFSNPDGFSSPCTDYVHPTLMSMESMEVSNISKHMGVSNNASSNLHHTHPPLHNKTLDDQVFANAQNEHGIIYDDTEDSEVCPVEIKSSATLKKIINDLRDAASKAHKGSSESHYHTSSSAKFNELHHNSRSRAYSSESTSSTPDLQSVQRPDQGFGHPTLHCILKYCNFTAVTIQRNDLPLFGLRLFQSVFTPRNQSHQRQSVFRSLSGRKPVISHHSSAFIPIASSCSDHESQDYLSLVAIDSVHGSINCSTVVYEGDYIIEVNGHYAAASTVDQVKQAISYSSSDLHLVVARPKSAINKPPNQFETDDNILKSMEKLSLKYDILQTDAEKYLDMIAELKLEVKRKDSHLSSLDSETQHLKKMVDEVYSKSRLKTEVSQNSLGCLTSEIRERDERITQLRGLLLRQTEVMQLDGRRGSCLDTEERVSAV